MMEIHKVAFPVPLKHLSNFWRISDMPLINCELFFTLTWSKNCVITDETTQHADHKANPLLLEIRAPTGATFEITDTKLYVSVFTLSTEVDNNIN